MLSTDESIQDDNPNYPEAKTSSAKGPGSKRQRRTLPTSEAYNLWASTYDSDGNVLQALDSLALEEDLLPRLLEQLADRADSNPNASKDGILRVLDFGCGTGRATLAFIAALQAPKNAGAVEKLLQSSDRTLQEVRIVGLDASSGMLDVARSRIPAHQTVAFPGLGLNARLTIQASFYEYDMLTSQPTTLDTQAWFAGYPDAILSTLVLEHIDIKSYFSAMARLLPSGKTSSPLLVMTNMHADMPGTYAGTQAAFNTSDTEKTLAGNSYPHKIPDIVREAKGADWTFVSNAGEEVQEREVESWMIRDDSNGTDGKQTNDTRRQGFLGPRGRKWIGVKCWFGALLQQMDSAS